MDWIGLDGWMDGVLLWLLGGWLCVVRDGDMNHIS